MLGRRNRGLVTVLAAMMLATGVASIDSLSVRAASLKSALETAYSENPTLNAQRAATRAADEALPQAKAGFRPKIFASADAGVNRSVVNNSFASTGTTLHPFGFGVTISQNLFNIGVLRSIDAAKSGIYASRETLRNVEQNTLFNAASSYADVILARKIVDIRKRNIAFLAEQLRASRARLEVGEGTRTDVAQAQGSLALAQAQLSAARAQLSASAATYQQIIGRTPKNLSQPRVPRRLMPSSLESAIKIGYSEHPAVRATQHLVDVALFNVKVAESALLPTVTLDGSLSSRFNSGSVGTRVDSASITAKLIVPIYQGGGATSKVREGKQNLGVRRIQVDESRAQVRNAIVSAWTQYQSANANLQANQAQVRAAKLALSGVIEERKVGQRTTLEVLTSQSEVLRARELQVQSQRNQIVASYALVSAIGRLNSRRLGLRVAHYSAKSNFNAVKDRWYGLRAPDGR